MAKIIINTATGALVAGPVGDGDELAATAGQTLITDLADSLLTSASVWDAATQRCVDPLPPTPALHQLCDMLVTAGTITLAQSDAIKAA